MNRSHTFLNVTNGALYCVNMHAGFRYNCPRAMLKMLVPYVALRLDMFPSSTRTDNLSAFQLVYNTPAYARIACQICFGAMRNVTNLESSSSMVPRTIGVAQLPDGTVTCSFFVIRNRLPLIRYPVSLYRIDTAIGTGRIITDVVQYCTQ
jgi:hypothetical protein